MNDWLDHVIYFFGSGLAYFVGLGFVMAGLALSLRAPGRAHSVTRNLMAILGAILIVISAIPLEWWLYALMAVVFCLWLPLEWLKHSLARKYLVIARCAMLAVSLLAIALELPYHLVPVLPPLDGPTFFLIGDSISAGLSDNEKAAWPNLLARQHPVNVRDFSKIGATVKSARKQAQRLGNEKGLILLEIGGNDVLGTTSVEEFEEHLELLLADVCGAERTVVMLELPLPPFANRFGLAQRHLSSKYGAILIPRRVLANVLTVPGATVDGIHLAPHGHQLMADTIWSIIGSEYK